MQAASISMNYNEIKRIREEFKLERHEVYTLMSEFNSMLYMQDNESEDSDNEEKPRNPYFENKTKSGITLKFFFEHTRFMKGILPEVKKIIVTALGLDADGTENEVNN